MATSLIVLAIVLVVVGLGVRTAWLTDNAQTRFRDAEVPKELTQSITELGRERAATLIPTIPFVDTAPSDNLDCPPQLLNHTPSSYSFEAFDPQTALRLWQTKSSKPDASFWHTTMAEHGRALQAAQVAEVTFVHGTFVGNDPFSMLKTIQSLSPSWHQTVEGPLGIAMKRAGDFVARDAGNFDRMWINQFEQSTGLPSSMFVWSSENTHAARLSAAVRLAEHLSHQVTMRPIPGESRILLVGHSHAGQVFALLLQLLYAVHHSDLLLKAASVAGEDISRLGQHLKHLQSISLDIVTLGTPVRYGWPKPAWPRILHIINHRGEHPTAGDLDGIITTRDGDYLQQLGIAGSDLPAPTAELRAINSELDQVLGPGCQPQKWAENLTYKKRIHLGGHTLLVNYRDQSSLGLPNFIATNFGHAIYTRRYSMEFMIALIHQYLYL